MTANNNHDPISQILGKAKPHFGKLTFGSVVGYCSGAAAKKVGKALAVLGGLAFIAIQSAVYSGYVAVDWDKVKDDAVAKIDTDGDGDLTLSDAKNYWKKVKAILTKNVPSAGGFSLGFMYGVRYN
eukprot:CAMPEP_0197246522 /NCGR_PEP_ID=MMETSP1429-20130617/15050_1 /TAXON_ID=49237 /ORGANISM="Chaetoceros  sp., Strain UNC1202" /LENGTH=125 /DNA_ID=CAMNT_0042707197 /DNA_START=68 /DNA_END=445 /DNA_ORIENTATION=+